MIKTLRSLLHPIMHCIALLLALSLLYGCGVVGGGRTSSSSPSAQPSHSLSVTVAPLAVEIRAGDVEQFSATVSGNVPAPVVEGFLLRSTSAPRIGRREGPRPGPIHPGAANKQVVWSINGTPGGNAAVGTISANGLYHSPSILPSPNTVDVTASSVAKPSVSQTALLTLYNPIPTVTSVTPSKVSVGAFTLTVSGQSFVEGAQVLFAGNALPTTFNSSKQLVANGVATQPGSARVWVSNPQPGPASSAAVLTIQVTAPQPGTAAPAVPQTSWNPAVLGVPWADDFVPIAANQIDVKTDPRLKVKAAGDGATDDTSAIRAAVQLASSLGGGVVYFPAGDYKIIAPSNAARGNPFVVPSRIILRGVSSTSSRVFVNDPDATSETDGTWTWGGISFQGSSQSGMTDLGVFAVATSASPCALLWNRGTPKASTLFFNNLDVHLNNCRSFWFETTDKLLVKNTYFDSHSSQWGPIYVVGSSNISLLGNRITYHFGRVHLENNVSLLMQGNTLIRDALNRDMDEGTAIESGGVELSFGKNIQMLTNTIQTLHAPDGETGDGEAIMTQQSNIQNVLDAGSITRITSTTLTDTNALWGPITVSRLARYPEVVAILTGSAAGEWRTITGIDTTTKTLMLDRPWDHLPELGALYSIFQWTLVQAIIRGNVLIDNPIGIVLYDGCLDCSLEENTLTNSRGIVLRTVDEALNGGLYPEGRRVHQVAINVKLLGNVVTNTSGLRPAYIVLDTEAFHKAGYRGAGMFNIQVVNNVLNPYPGNPSQAYNLQHNEIAQDGFFPCFLFGPAAVKEPVTTIFRNITFWNNSQSAPITYASSFLPYTTRACVTNSPPPAP
jgi:hypothetical protein